MREQQQSRHRIDFASSPIAAINARKVRLYLPATIDRRPYQFPKVSSRTKFDQMDNAACHEVFVANSIPGHLN